MNARRLIPVVVGLAVTLSVLWLQFTDLPWAQQLVTRLDYLAYDLRLKAALDPRPKIDPRIVIVDVDEKSLKEEGHWPWPRDRIASLVERLFTAGATVVAFDMVFPEAERNSAQNVLARLEKRGIEHAAVAGILRDRLSEFDNNALLAEQLSGRDVVLGFVMHSEEAPVGILPRPSAFTDPALVSETSLLRASSYTGNVGELHPRDIPGGFFSLLPDGDGIYRRAPMLQRFEDGIYPSLALETVRLFLLVDRLRLRTASVGSTRVVEAIELGDRVIPTDSFAQVMIPFRERGSFRYVSATDVLRDRVADSPFAGNIVLIGTTAQGLFDLRATPVAGVFPGVEVHANLIAGILESRFPVEPSWADGANFTLTLFTGLLLSLLLPRLAPTAMVLVSAVVALVMLGANVLIWTQWGLILALAPLAMLIGTISPFNIAYGFWKESHDRRRLKDMFGLYVPPQRVEEMNNHPDQDFGLKGESRDMSVLFCDIRGFTTIAEGLDAGTLKEILNQFFTPMTRIIFENRGTIDKYVGDMIMAFWGAPVADPDHGAHAVDAALAMLKESEALGAAFASKGLPPLAVGIGINSGMMNVGDMGSEYRRAYTVIGDAVNLASRLEGTTRDYGVGLVVGEATYRKLGDAFACRELDRVRVKGKATAVTVYEPLCRRAALTPDQETELARHGKALALFRARDWEAADAAFAELQAGDPGARLYALYRERIAVLRVNDPGESWDGVYERNSK